MGYDCVVDPKVIPPRSTFYNGYISTVRNEAKSAQVSREVSTRLVNNIGNLIKFYPIVSAHFLTKSIGRADRRWIFINTLTSSPKFAVHWLQSQRWQTRYDSASVLTITNSLGAGHFSNNNKLAMHWPLEKENSLCIGYCSNDNKLAMHWPQSQQEQTCYALAIVPTRTILLYIGHCSNKNKLAIHWPQSQQERTC